MLFSALSPPKKDRNIAGKQNTRTRARVKNASRKHNSRSDWLQKTLIATFRKNVLYTRLSKYITY